MLTFLQYLQETDENDAQGDFTYTTKQGKTDDHVKGFIKGEISNPKIELSDNGVSIDGVLDSKYNKYINIDTVGKQITATSDLSKQLTSIVSDLISKMTDQSVVQIRATSTKGDAIPQGSKTNYTLMIKFEFDGDDFDGTVDITLNTLSNTKENVSLERIDKCDISIDGRWREA